MKQIKIIILLLVLPLFSFSQNVKYSVDFGCNFSYFTKKIKEPEVFTDYGFYQTTTIVVHDYHDIKPQPKVGVFFDNIVTFKINERVFFNTGLGISLINLEKRLFSVQKKYGINGYEFGVIGDFDKSNIYNLLSIKLPIHFGLYLFDNKMHISSGMDIPFVIFDRFETTDSFKTFNTTFLNILLKTEFCLQENLWFGIDYSRSITDILNEKYSKIFIFEFNSERKVRLNNFSAYFSYKF